MKNKTKSLVLLTLAIFSFVSLASLGSAVTLFSDGFESGTLGGWDVNEQPGANPWVASQESPETGIWHAQAKPDFDIEPATSLSKVISTVNHKNIVFSYKRQLGATGGNNGLDASDEFKVWWSPNGVDFFVLEDSVEDVINNADYVAQSFPLPAGAEDNANFAILFECTADAADEFCRVDDVSITGDLITSSITITPDNTIVRAGENAIVEVANNGTGTLTIDMSSDTTTFGTITFSPDSFDLTSGARRAVTVILDTLTNLKFGDNLITIRADAGSGIADTATITVQKGFCDFGSKGNLTIRDVTIDNSGEGQDDEWFLLDEVEIEVDVENDGNDDVEDVFVELALLDSAGIDQIGDLDFSGADDERIDLGDIRDNDEETATFTFKVPGDIESGRYKLAVKAYGDRAGEENECADEFNGKLFEDISVEKQDDEGKFIGFTDVVFSPEQATCGERVTLTTDVVNVGDSGEQERVRVHLKSTEFNLDEIFEIRNELDEGEKETVTFDFTVPENAENRDYRLRLSADYEYDNGFYEETSEEETPAILTVLGCAGGPTDDRIADIDAELDSDAKAGEELIVSATITNLEDERASFTINAVGYQSWATLESVSERLVDLDAGESREVVFTFTVDEDATGEESFIIEARSDLGVETREVVVGFEEENGRGGFELGGNTTLWIIAIVNVILIILIIIVAVRVSRR